MVQEPSKATMLAFTDYKLIDTGSSKHMSLRSRSDLTLPMLSSDVVSY